MLKIQKLPLAMIFFCGNLIILFSFLVFVSPASAQAASPGIPSLGKGVYEVMVFSDYFCPPCKQIDAKAEPLMKELLATGKVKITFVDVPFHRATPIYARHYLYAVNAGVSDEKVFQIRRLLFQAAQEKRIGTKEALVSYLKEEKIEWMAFDEKPVFLMLSQIIKQNKIDQTPTCVIRYSLTDEKKYVGTEEIWNGLTQLKASMAIGEKK